MKDIRVVVPLKWNSALRRELFHKLQQKGYTWSCGDSLSQDKEKYHNLAYVAIYVYPLHVKYSSKIELVQKAESECGFNYVLPSNVNVDKIFHSLDYIKSVVLNEIKEEDALRSFVNTHYSIKDMFCYD